MTLPTSLRRKPCALRLAAAGAVCVLRRHGRLRRRLLRLFGGLRGLVSLAAAAASLRRLRSGRFRSSASLPPATGDFCVARRCAAVDLSARSVLTRARSRRVLRIDAVSSSRFVKFLKRGSGRRPSRASSRARARSSTRALAQVLGLHDFTSSRGRGTCSATGSLWPARRKASRAVVFVDAADLVHHAARAGRRPPTPRRRPCRHPCGLRAASS